MDDYLHPMIASQCVTAYSIYRLRGFIPVILCYPQF